MKKVFLFDLDSTITREEILPTIAEEINKGEEMRLLTESVMMGEVPFEESFRARVKILQEVPVSKMADRIEGISLSSGIVNFIKNNRDICYVVTGNLDVWIEKLIKKIGAEDHLFCSKADIKDDKIIGINYILRKEDSLTTFRDSIVVAVGDGSNDLEMISKANIGIGYGGVRRIAPCLLDVCDYAVYDEKKLCELLNLIKDEKDDN